MAGALVHAPRFEQKWYTGRDGLRHHELVAVGGNIEIVRWSSWYALLDYFETLGVPRDAWPTYESSIDLPLSDVSEKDENLRPLVATVVPDDRCPDPELMALVLDVVRSGEIFYYVIE